MAEMDTSRFENRTEYVSVIITTVNRPDFLEQCVDSIHEHANYPFELIVVDDNGQTLESTNVRRKISTLILNMGDPLRQPIQQNRAISVATSKYIVRIEDDCVINRPCFKEIKTMLDRPYVGFINAESKPMREHININGTKFVVGGNVGGAWCNAFRKDVWKEIGGLCEWSHISNSVLCCHILKHGYWRAWLIGDKIAKNIDQEVHEGKKSTNMCLQRAHYPKLFNIDAGKYTDLCSERHVYNNKNFNSFRDVNGSIANIMYWKSYVDLVTTDWQRPITSINWEVAKRHGHDKWKELIEKDFNS